MMTRASYSILKQVCLLLLLVLGLIRIKLRLEENEKRRASMLTKNDILRKFPDFGENMNVKSQDNENLGKVISAVDDSFTIEKGFFFPQDFILRYSDISAVRDGTLYVNLTKDELARWKEPTYEGWQQINLINERKLEAASSPEQFTTSKLETSPSFVQSKASRLEATPSPEQSRATNEIKVPITEEELVAQKSFRETGAVRLKKVVHTEFKRFTVPVMKEEVRVERTPMSEQRQVAPGEAVFQESTISVPVREEVVEIQKRPVVKEEVRVTKVQHQEQREYSGEIRKEEVEIQQEGIQKQKKIA